MHVIKINNIRVWFSGGGSVAWFCGLLRDTLWMEFDNGKLEFGGSYGGFSAVDRPRDKRKVGGRCVEDGGESG